MTKDMNYLASNSKSNAAAGVAIAFRIAKDMKVLNVVNDEEDRILLLKLMIEEEIITVVSFYDTNVNTALYLEKIDNMLEHNDITNGYIIGGDFNVILDKEFDQKGFGGKQHSRTTAKKYIDTGIDNGFYQDIYRQFNKEGKAVTYVPDTIHDRLKPTKGRRLDMFLTSKEFMDKTTNLINTTRTTLIWVKPDLTTDQ